MLERVISQEAALGLHAIENLTHCRLALEGLSYRIKRDLLPFLLIEIDLALRFTRGSLDQGHQVGPPPPHLALLLRQLLQAIFLGLGLI